MDELLILKMSNPKKFNYTEAKDLLYKIFGDAETAFSNKKEILVSENIALSSKIIFKSNTQAFREVLLGCCVIRILDQSINIRLPYINLGPNSYNGRTLDETVINPFLQGKTIPCSRGPFLSAFRRSVKFTEETAAGLRDKIGYAAFLQILDELESISDTKKLELILKFILIRFLELREANDIIILQIGKLSLAQYDNFLDELLKFQSGGLLPMLVSVAMFNTIKRCYSLNWQIEWQGINVSDKASKSGGDITITEDGQVLFAVEVTERPIDGKRVIATFNTKISPNKISDYLFIYSNMPPLTEVLPITKRYFAQGHDVNFLQIKNWIIHLLATIGVSCRQTFFNELVVLVNQPSVSSSIKVRWNDLIKRIE